MGLEDGPASKDFAHNLKDLSLDSQYLCLIQLKQNKPLDVAVPSYKSRTQDTETESPWGSLANVPS